MKILFLSRWFPYPPNNGSKVRILNLLKVLSTNHVITLLSFNDEPEKSVQIDGLESICNEVHIVPWKEFNPHSIKSFIGYFSFIPRSVIDTFSSEMARKIQSILNKDEIDVIIASEIEMASYIKYFNNKNAIFEEIEIGVPYERYIRTTSAIDKVRYGLTWVKHKNYLKFLLKNYPYCTVASSEERELLSDTGVRDNNISVIPNFIDFTRYQDFSSTEKSNTIIYTGSFRYQPNYEAMIWFIEEIFPAIINSVPDTLLIITGDHMNLPLPQETNVIKTGYVDDIRPLISNAAVSIVPLLTGGGTRLKILEAVALRTPVVSTSKGAQGIDLTHGKNILLADTPQDFANKVICILKDPKLGESIADQAIYIIKKKYSSDGIREKYENILQKVSQNSKQ